jgi:hypothetical protein
VNTEYEIRENGYAKWFKSPNYSYCFNKLNGEFVRIGSDLERDPLFSPFGPEILDLEIASGQCLGNCPHCYKCNGKGGRVNMSFETFKKVFHNIPNTLTQIAFGITDIHGNPDFFNMMGYARSHGIIPNYTCHGLDVDRSVAARTAEICGAVAVSIVNKQRSYDSICMFTEAGMDQVNIHFVLAHETIERAKRTVDDIKSDSRLAKLNAIVFLQYKPKGKDPNMMSPIPSVEHYKDLIQYCEDAGVSYGFDSCSAPMYMKSVEDHPRAKQLIQFAEPCESFGMFSSYINVNGDYFPCSFCEGEPGWESGLDILGCENSDDFLKNIWHSQKVSKWRNKILTSNQSCECSVKKHCRCCPIFDITPCKTSLLTVGD